MDIPVYGGLFFSAFLAATVVPAQSEAVLLALTASQKYSVSLLVMVAALGNVLGAVVNWCLGRGIERFRYRRWFPVGEALLVRAQGWYSRYGRWSLLLGWLPVVGDALTVAAGVMRERLLFFVPLVALGKTLRYIAVVYAVAG